MTFGSDWTAKVRQAGTQSDTILSPRLEFGQLSVCDQSQEPYSDRREILGLGTTVRTVPMEGPFGTRCLTFGSIGCPEWGPVVLTENRAVRFGAWTVRNGT